MIEKVKDGLKHCGIDCNCGGCPYKTPESGACVSNLIRDALSEIQALEQEQAWIPATTPPTFPENETYGKAFVIAATETSTFELKWHRTLVRGKRVERWEDDNGIYKGKPIIAWKPFPKPPKWGEQK